MGHLPGCAQVVRAVYQKGNGSNSAEAVSENCFPNFQRQGPKPGILECQDYDDPMVSKKPGFDTTIFDHHG